MSDIGIMRFDLPGWAAKSRWGLNARTGGWWARLVPDGAVSPDAARLYFPATPHDIVPDPWTLGEMISIELQCTLDEIERAMLTYAPLRLVEWLEQILAEAERAVPR